MNPLLPTPSPLREGELDTIIFRFNIHLHSHASPVLFTG
jgi:hypothetical protein